MVYPMTLDVAADQVRISMDYVTRGEEMTVNGREAICVEGQDRVGGYDMTYYDVRSSLSDSGPNYIDHIEPGETVTVHMAWIVNEDELDMLYLAPMWQGPLGANGIVDIRQ